MNYKIGIIGGGGYTAGELMRLLIHHPQVEIDFVLSNSQAGKAISLVHQDLVGETDLVFTNKMNLGVDVIFICSGHGFSKTFLAENEIPFCVIFTKTDKLKPKAIAQNIAKYKFNLRPRQRSSTRL